MKGTVVEVKGNMLKVEFADLPANYDKWINKLSDEVAPPGSKTTQDIAWRQSILQSEANTVIDAYKDREDKWVEATILETKTEQGAANRTFKSALVAYRIYHDEGLNSDNRGTYDGLPWTYDEWIPLMSRRIAPHFTKCTKKKPDEALRAS